MVWARRILETNNNTPRVCVQTKTDAYTTSFEFATWFVRSGIFVLIVQRLRQTETNRKRQKSLMIKSRKPEARSTF